MHKKQSIKFKNGKGSVFRIRFVTVFIKTVIALIIIRFINWYFVVAVITGAYIRTLKVDRSI